MPGRFLLLLLLTVLLPVIPAAAQDIAYTVQVVAVSDQSQGFTLLRELSVAGYPAYAARAATEGGDVVRVRVGGFGNRAAALLFAEAMPDFPVEGNRPLPALADNIPQGVMPYRPRLLLDTELESFTLLAWPGGVAVEEPAAPDGLHTYHLFTDGAEATFEAWLAWPDSEGLVLRYRDLTLWPDEWEEVPGEVLAREVQTRLEFLAARLGVEPDRLERAIRRRADVPVVVVLERFNPHLNPDVGQLLAVTVPEEDGSPWSGALLGDGETPGEREVLLEVDGELEPAGLETEEFSISSDDPFMRQSVPGDSRGWLLAAGTPLWTDGTFVLAGHEGRFLLYDLVNGN
ncbi:MAG TPA: SPOR domain-containing protein [Deinococcales bacterium]|nr:SPOR domain-containing protein [Deinococcales bacterium]